MALIKCPECGKEISNSAKVCPHCGYKQKKLDIAKHKKISTYILIIGILLFVCTIIWTISTSDQDLAIRAGYYFGNATSASEWRDYQTRSTIREIIGDIGICAFIVGVVYKIVIKVQSSHSK